MHHRSFRRVYTLKMQSFFIAILAFFVLAVGGYIATEMSPAGTSRESADADIAERVVIPASATLSLAGRGLAKAPEYIFGRSDIEELDLSHNALEGALPAEVRHLTRLRVLDLSDNRFTGVPAEIGQLGNLEILDLSNNALTGLPYELGNLAKLKLLDLRGNDYSQADLARIRERLPSFTRIKAN